MDNKPITRIQNPDDDERQPPPPNPPQTLPLQNDQGSITPDTEFQLTIKNASPQPVRAKTVRYSNIEPQVFSIGLPDFDDIGNSNPQSQYSVQFRNEAQRKVRMKTVRSSNQNPVVYSVDLAPGQSSSVVVFSAGARGCLQCGLFPMANLYSLVVDFE